MAVFITLLIIAIVVAVGLLVYYRRPIGLTPGPKLTPLEEGDEEFYLDSWNHIQGSFVDAPPVALDNAEKLVTRLLTARGYPVEDQAALIAQLSRRHGAETPGFEKARALAASPDPTPTEDVRLALIDLRVLTDALLHDAGVTVPERAAVRGRDQAALPASSAK